MSATDRDREEAIRIAATCLTASDLVRAIAEALTRARTEASPDRIPLDLLTRLRAAVNEDVPAGRGVRLHALLDELQRTSASPAPEVAGDAELLAGLLRLAGWRDPGDDAGGWEPPTRGSLRYGLRDAAARAIEGAALRTRAPVAPATATREWTHPEGRVTLTGPEDLVEHWPDPFTTARQAGFVPAPSSTRAPVASVEGEVFDVHERRDLVSMRFPSNPDHGIVYLPVKWPGAKVGQRVRVDVTPLDGGEGTK